MARLHSDGEPNFPPELAEFDASQWNSELDWQVARVRYARALGYKQYRVLPLIQAMTKRATGECSTSEGEPRES
jgi:hypothetical protein